MGKLILRVLACILGITMCLVALVAVTNLYDPPLDPTVAEILAKPRDLSEEQTKAFYYLLGLHAAESVETAEAKGLELWKRFESGDKTALQNLDHNKAFPKVEFKGCGESDVCGVAELEADPMLAQHILDNEEALKRLNHLVSYGESGHLLLAQDSFWSAPQFRTVPVDQNLARLFYLQLAQWFKENESTRAFQLIVQSNHYMRNVLLTGTEIDRQFAALYLKNNAHLLKTEKERLPELEISEEVKASFQIPQADEILNALLETELKIFASTFSYVEKAGDLVEHTGVSSGTPDRREWWHEVPVTPGLKPNETLNKFYEIQVQTASTECDHINQENELECVPARSWLKPSPWFYVRNPIGHGLALLNSNKMSRKNSRLFSRLDEIREFADQLN